MSHGVAGPRLGIEALGMLDGQHILYLVVNSGIVGLSGRVLHTDE